MSNENLPVKEGEDFIAEIESMNLDDLKTKLFLVGVSTGDRNKSKFLSTTVHGPYTFEEMCEEVGFMWSEYQHHAKAIIVQKDRTKVASFLDENTTDYIEAHYQDIIVESMLDGVFEKEYTCRAGIIEDNGTEDPRQTKSTDDQQSTK